MKQLDLSSIGKTEILVWAKLSNNSVSTGRHRPKQANEHSEPVPANRGCGLRVRPIMQQKSISAEASYFEEHVCRGSPPCFLPALVS